MLKNGQTYFKNLAVFTPQDFKSMFGHFSTLCNKGLMITKKKLKSPNQTESNNHMKKETRLLHARII